LKEAGIKSGYSVLDFGCGPALFNPDFTSLKGTK